ncbi:unnamed protein product [Penicillium nalgiovense]|uniref:Uncharacterized protein n=1 Tax=Penicillium nalgiovense TaxID=60175 RepID=A0A1V6Y9Y1_PENNA|nr:hypothetical protein PENNAL_c0029G03208 [Penicillium nalgiovense]CAG7947067.1 unnamed protein product [Penicillium nalgiovense]CAG8000134.1 unnamed protein product [Penicillium nalgiovense]CAG8017053.1 unnamed protein product [Penicillium nalgiovense]CAG8020928.1 unnamed protein product [Penicillium nalgiovense]
MQPLYNALIRTHHITSRKKVAALKRAADTHQCAVLLRSGGCPGIMYVEGGKEPVESWVDVVRRLRYKDFQLVTRPGVVEEEDGLGKRGTGNRSGEKKDGKELGLAVGLDEVESVKEFGGIMAKRGVWNWWRRGMGYA